MSAALKKFQQHAKRLERDKEKPLSREERKALHNLRKEAKEHGATLESNGKGGLNPSLVLTVMRRDDYTCKRCDKNQHLTVHHKGGIVESKWLSQKGHKNEPQNIVTLCADCHDQIHEQAKKDGIDSSQVTPKGDVGKGKHGHD